MVIATTVTIRPSGLYYRSSTSYWTNYERAYDGDQGTYAKDVSRAAHFDVPVSGIPQGATITSGYIRVLYYRGGDTSDYVRAGFSYTNASTSSGERTTLSDAYCTTLTDYHTRQWTQTPLFTFTKAQQDAWKNAAHPLIFVGGGNTSRVYEIEVVITYEEPSQIYPGGNQASAVHVGSTKAQAVYLGNTKIL